MGIWFNVKAFWLVLYLVLKISKKKKKQGFFPPLIFKAEQWRCPAAAYMDQSVLAKTYWTVFVHLVVNQVHLSISACFHWYQDMDRKKVQMSQGYSVKANAKFGLSSVHIHLLSPPFLCTLFSSSLFMMLPWPSFLSQSMNSTSIWAYEGKCRWS